MNILRIDNETEKSVFLCLTIDKILKVGQLRKEFVMKKLLSPCFMALCILNFIYCDKTSTPIEPENKTDVIIKIINTDTNTEIASKEVPITNIAIADFANLNEREFNLDDIPSIRFERIDNSEGMNVLLSINDNEQIFGDIIGNSSGWGNQDGINAFKFYLYSINNERENEIVAFFGYESDDVLAFSEQIEVDLKINNLQLSFDQSFELPSIPGNLNDNKIKIEVEVPIDRVVITRENILDFAYLVVWKDENRYYQKFFVKNTILRPSRNYSNISEFAVFKLENAFR